MKQILQHLRTGELEVSEVPSPGVRPGHLLIQTHRTLISAGTERMLVSFAKSGLLGKAKSQPEKVKQVLDKIKTDGLLPTLHSVFARLDEPLPLGYCNCGTVLEAGPGVEGFAAGDRVANNGPHAEIVCVPRNLCAKVPDNVTDDQACFTVLASIGLQGIRLINPTFGETVVVMGLGLIGLLSVQMLRASGCRVLGVDLDPAKLELAKYFGAEVVDVPNGADPVAAAMSATGGRGVDGVLITASAKEDSIVHQSALMSRKRGRVVLVGVVNLNLDRSDFYEKEISFQVSCSYGPGRYDDEYEGKGHDYPYGFVRWTEQRNFEAILQSMAEGKLVVDRMISERIPIEQAGQAYQLLTDDPSRMALVLTYPRQVNRNSTVSLASAGTGTGKSGTARVVAGLIGAGNFAKLTLLPALKGVSIRLKTVGDIEGVAGTHAAKKFGFEQATNDYRTILEDPQINTVFITTRHDLHAKMVLECLEAGKHVHVEKPLCLNPQELQHIREVYEKNSHLHLHVGLNRRFSPHAQTIKKLVQSRSSAMCMSWVINAGHIPSHVWVHDRNIGGGRIIGEGCHWMDFMLFLADAPIQSVSAVMMGEKGGEEIRDDKMTISMRFTDGSIGTLHYFANGSKSFPKETFELFCGGKVFLLDNFRKLKGYGVKGFKNRNLLTQDKGHRNQFKSFIAKIEQGESPLIPFDQIENVTLASFRALESAASGETIWL